MDAEELALGGDRESADDGSATEEGGSGEEADEQYDLQQFGIYQALPVDGEPDWSTGGAD